jgi:hypothetical protein
MATIYEILEREHGAVDHLLGELHDTDVAEAKRRTALVAQLVEELAALSRAEQEIVYPLLTREPDGNAEMRHALEDHGAIETAMRDLVACEVHDEMWIAKLEVLREAVDHHVERDEGEMFTILRKVLDDDGAQRLAIDFGRRKSVLAGRAA